MQQKNKLFLLHLGANWQPENKYIYLNIFKSLIWLHHQDLGFNWKCCSQRTAASWFWNDYRCCMCKSFICLFDSCRSHHWYVVLKKKSPFYFGKSKNLQTYMSVPVLGEDRNVFIMSLFYRNIFFKIKKSLKKLYFAWK